MRPDAGSPARNGWTLMMADVVALMLAFFVLSFSMREMVETDREPIGDDPATMAARLGGTAEPGGPAFDPARLVPLALAPHEGPATDQLQAPERPAADAPPLAYLAALIQGDGSVPTLTRVHHDDTMVAIELPDLPDDAAGSPGDQVRRPLLSLAFLARRFDLDMTVAMPSADDTDLADRVARVMGLRAWMADAAGFDALSEVTFAAAEPGGSAARSKAWAALVVKVANDEFAGSSPP